MRESVLIYFAGEKNAGLCLVGLGIASLAAAALFFPTRWDVRSFAITLGIVGIVELAIGVGLYVKTGPQVRALLAQLDTDAMRFYTSETARMVKVQRNFVILEYAWLGLLAVAAIVAISQKARFWITGTALGVLIGVAVILTFDLVAERRGAAYLDALKSGIGSAPVSPSR